MNSERWELIKKVFAEILDVVECVLDQSGHRAVVTGGSDHDGVGIA